MDKETKMKFWMDAYLTYIRAAATNHTTGQLCANAKTVADLALDAAILKNDARAFG